jgi:hypothetical protein
MHVILCSGAWLIRGYAGLVERGVVSELRAHQLLGESLLWAHTELDHTVVSLVMMGESTRRMPKYVLC